jgi:hypothetical protein
MRDKSTEEYFSSTPLYVEDSYLGEFDARVIRLGPSSLF